jgi:hypothetical protein
VFVTVMLWFYRSYWEDRVPMLYPLGGR